MPFFDYCLDCIFVVGVCMDTADSSMVIIFPKKLFPLFWISLTKAAKVSTLRSICSCESSLGTHLALFFTSPSSS
jgi:hypothetical protein